jgi:subtilisin
VVVNVGYADSRGREAARRTARSIEREFAFDALTMTVPRRALTGLARDPHVRYVEEDGVWHAIPTRPAPAKPPGGCEPWPGCKDDGNDGGGGGDTSQTLPWGVDRVDAEVAHAAGKAGAGVHVAIVDSGIDTDHPDLQANLGAGTAFVSCRGGKKCGADWDDDNGHGTHCAGIVGAVDNGEGVVGVAPEATLHAVKVLDKSGSGSWSGVAAGIEYVADQGWDVASMSLGGGHSNLVADAVAYAAGAGVVLVAAAGNSGPCTDCVGYPAAYPEVIAVSSTTDSDTPSSFSSTGPEVDIAAPGSAVYSTVPGGYDTFSGTSMACPHVSGAAAQVIATGTADIRSQLTSTAEDIGLSSTEGGAGLLDVAAALGLDSSDD